MFTYEGTITDAYGITHTNPVFQIEYFNAQSNTGIQGSLDNEGEGYTTESFDNHSANYGIIFWTNEAARLDGATPLMFVRKNQRNNNNYNFNPTSVLGTESAILEACEEHFLDEVLVDFIVEEE